MRYKFIATAKARQNPVRVLLGGSWVGIGGPIVTKKNKWPEASEAQYQQAFEELKMINLVARIVQQEPDEEE